MSEPLVNPNENPHPDDKVTVEEALRRLTDLRQRLFGFFVERRTRQEGESPTRLQLHLMTRLAHHEASTVSEIAGFLGVSRPTASQLTSALAERGWLEREMESQDRRRHRVTLTDAGRALVATRQAEREAHLRRIVENLTPEERASLLHLSQRIASLILADPGHTPERPDS